MRCCMSFPINRFATAVIIRYDTIKEFNVDSKPEYYTMCQLSLFCLEMPRFVFMLPMAQ